MAFQSDESRNKDVTAYTDPVTGSTILNSRAAYRYRDRADNLQHEVKAGDTWWGIAARYYYYISGRPAGLWWVVMNFQPDPVIDPTLSLRPGLIVILPNPTVVLNEILGAERSTFQ